MRPYPLRYVHSYLFLLFEIEIICRMTHYEFGWAKGICSLKNLFGWMGGGIFRMEGVLHAIKPVSVSHISLFLSAYPFVHTHRFVVLLC